MLRKNGDCRITGEKAQWLPGLRVVNVREFLACYNVLAPVRFIRVLPHRALPCIVLQQERLEIAQVVAQPHLFVDTPPLEGFHWPYVVDGSVCPCHRRVRVFPIPCDALRLHVPVHLLHASVFLRGEAFAGKHSRAGVQALAPDTSCHVLTPR